MAIEIDPAYCHAYKWWQYRLLITMESTTWVDRCVNGEKFPGESCIFFSEDGGKSWTEFYLLTMIGDRSGKFSALVLDREDETFYALNGAGGELKYMDHSYELVMDEHVDFRNVTRLTNEDRVWISNTDAYRQIQSIRG